MKCKKCNSENTRMFDNQPLDFDMPAGEYDSELTTKFICNDCGNQFWQNFELVYPIRDQKEKIDEAKAILKRYGYAVDNLWHINDVQSNYICDDNKAREIVNSATDNDWITEQINVTISDLADLHKLKEKEEN